MDDIYTNYVVCQKPPLYNRCHCFYSVHPDPSQRSVRLSTKTSFSRLYTEHVFKGKHPTRHSLLPKAAYLLCLLGERLQNVGLPGVVAIGVLQPLQDALPEDQHGHSELVPEQLDGVDVYDDIDRIGQQLQGELRLKEGVDLLDVVGNIFTNVLRQRQAST